jgi:GPH family glycoside/pentoside/hexuronide:cation symporter
MTSDPDERTSISTYRQVAANSAGFIVGALAIPMVRFFGHGNDVLGYQLTMGLLSVVSVVFFVIAFFTTKERIQPDPAQKSDLGQDLSDLFRNRPWVVLFMATLFYFAAIVIRGNVMLPYCRYIAGDLNLFSVLNGFGLAALIAGVTCSTALSKRIGKRQIFIASMILTGAFAAALLVISPHATVLIVVTEVLRQFSYGLSGPIIWSMMGDVADYGEWKTGRRASGTVTSAVVFALWAGLAVGGAVAGWLFSFYGFASEAVTQTAQAQTGILLTASVYAGLAFVAAGVCMFFYPITREVNQKIANELADRRKRITAS